MNKLEFDALRALTGKTIEGDIQLEPSKAHPSSKRAEAVCVHNSSGYPLFLDVTEKPDLPSYSFNFSIAGVGPICRLDVNGTIHKDAGRTHKHELQAESDPEKNLPTAHAVQTLEHSTLQSAWRWLCTQAHIEHAGNII